MQCCHVEVRTANFLIYIKFSRMCYEKANYTSIIQHDAVNVSNLIKVNFRQVPLVKSQNTVIY